MAELKYWLWLNTRNGLGPAGALTVLDHFSTPERAYYAGGEDYESLPLTPFARQSLLDKSMDEPNKILGDCDRIGLRIMTFQDAGYPQRLRQIAAPPAVLYIKGKVFRFDEEPAVAVVGMRKCSLRGREWAERFGMDLASSGALVVSGMAEGVDCHAVRGALKAGKPAVSVLAGGVDVVFPYENRYLYADVAAAGALISEYPPGTEPRAGHFPVRNRIISGLSLGVVVLEAPEQSGTLITAGRALDQGRDVFAVPGQVGDRRCAGSNQLLRDGAGVVTDAWDVLGHYAGRFPHKIRSLRMEEPRRFGGGAPEEKPEKKKEKKPEAPAQPERPVLDLSGDHGLTDDQLRIVRALNGRTVQVDDLVEETQIPTRRVLSALTVLELDRIVTQESGKRFSLAVALQ